MWKFLIVSTFADEFWETEYQKKKKKMFSIESDISRQFISWSAFIASAKMAFKHDRNSISSFVPVLLYVYNERASVKAG